MSTYKAIARELEVTEDDVRSAMNAAERYTVNGIEMGSWFIPSDKAAGYASRSYRAAHAYAVGSTREQAVRNALTAGWRANRNNW